MRRRKISRPHADLLEIINKVAEISNLHNIEYLIEIGHNKIDGFVGGAHVVKIKGFINKFKIEKKFIIKWHSDPADRACFRKAYLREIAYYEHIVPLLLEIQRKYKVIEGLRMKFSNCIFSSSVHDKECLVVLTEHKEYFIFDRFNKIDLSHATLVIKNLAKLHALSFALNKLYPEKCEEFMHLFAKDVQYGDVTVIPKCLISYFIASVNVVSDTNAKERLMKLAPNILFLLNKCTSSIQNYSTICHADCWNNSLIFKYYVYYISHDYSKALSQARQQFHSICYYEIAPPGLEYTIPMLLPEKCNENNKRPVDSLLIDFQLTRYASPVTDLSYFFYMSTVRDFLDKYYETLINIYYGTLSAVLRQCDLKVEEIYPRTVFQKHLMEYSVYGLVEALISMKIITAGSEEAIKMTEMKFSQPDEMCQYELENQSLYIERVNDVVRHFFDKNYSLCGVLNH